jgi:glutamate-1-semialdehyde 2,1-aminomutase
MPSDKHWRRKYENNTSNSRRLFERAGRILPGGVSYSIRDFMPYPFYVDHAFGSRLYDVDGNCYTDYWTGHGALILGHAPKKVVEAVKEQIDRGSHYGYSHELEVELAEKIVEKVPSAEMIRFTSSGTEANMYAVRLARAFTGRRKIVKFEGGWHGGYDALQKAVHAPFTAPESAGLDPMALENTLVLPFNDIKLAKEAIESESPACVILEPLLGAAGFIPSEREFLEGLRDLCDKTGTLLIFDEIVTGFRLAPGGAQDLFGIYPDISILGKIMGGGFPIGALCGREDIFQHINHRKYPDYSERSFHGGTFTANPVSMVAGITTLNQLNDALYRHLRGLGDQARNGLEDIFERKHVVAAITGMESAFCIHFQKEKPLNAKDAERNDIHLANSYFNFLLSEGITYVSPRLPHMFISSAHTAKDIEEFLVATESFMDSIHS